MVGTPISPPQNSWSFLVGKPPMVVGYHHFLGNPHIRPLPLSIKGWCESLVLLELLIQRGPGKFDGWNKKGLNKAEHFVEKKHQLFKKIGTQTAKIRLKTIFSCVCCRWFFYRIWDSVRFIIIFHHHSANTGRFACHYGFKDDDLLWLFWAYSTCWGSEGLMDGYRIP